MKLYIHTRVESWPSGDGQETMYKVMCVLVRIHRSHRTPQINENMQYRNALIDKKEIGENLKIQ